MENIIINTIFVLILISASYMDIKNKQVSNIFVVLIILLSLIFKNDISYGQRIIEGIIISFPLIIIWIIKKQGLGAGDIKIIFACTLLLGMERVLWGLLVGMVTVFVINKWLVKEKEIPLLPYISFGIIVSMYVINK